MDEVGFVNLLIVAAIAFGAPLALGLVPGLRIPAVVAEIGLGIAVGPHGLGWVEIDAPVEIVARPGEGSASSSSRPRLSPTSARSCCCRSSSPASRAARARS